MSARWILALAAVAIGFSAADTYVVVLALPDMMTSAGLSLDELQRAAPIVSGFLLGYVAVLPIIGRISDLRGRVPVLIGSLVVFAVGSVITAAGYDLTWIVVGRFLQGIGGGGLIPPTLALIADRWPPSQRGMPLGIIGAVQELGSVMGPLYGALVLSVGTWRSIFWLNAAVGLLLVATFWPARSDRRAGRFDLVGASVFTLLFVAMTLTLMEPAWLMRGVTTGLAFIPVTGTSRWLSPVGLAVFVLAAIFVLVQWRVKRSLLAWREWGVLRREIDIIGGASLTVALAAVIVTFATAEPETAALSEDAWLLLPLAGLAALVFAWRQRVAPHPIIPRGAIARRPAWGAVLVSFFVGAALIAALVDIPFFARLTTERESQLGAALILVRFLVALPIGAILGGWWLRWIPAAWLTAAAMGLTSFTFIVMSWWDATALEQPVSSTLVLVACGFGFGVAIAPVNAALLDHTEDAVHGVASSLVIVARMVGMLVGISVLTTLGLRAFHSAAAKIPTVEELCDGASTACTAYGHAVRDAGIEQLSAVFLGAAVCAGIAVLVALATLPLRRATVQT